MPIRLVVVARLVSRVVCVAVLVLVATRLPLARPQVADAAVSRVQGFSAIVDGWRSWYGSYGMGELGHAWCIDHGSRAPDPTFAYVPTDLDVPIETQRAMAWILGAHGLSPDPETAAALMLALHDFMGAVYPSGPLDVDRLGVDRMSGFGGAEVGVLDRARSLKAEGRARSHLEGPLSLDVSVSPQGLRPGQSGALDVHVTDANGLGVAGILLHAAVTGAVLTGPVEARTDADGGLRLPFRAVAGGNHFEVTGMAPDLRLQAFAPTERAAQRVARPAVVQLRGTTEFAATSRQRLALSKTGDAEAYLPVVGARFEVRTPGGHVVEELSIGPSGQAETDLAAGHYEVHEVAPPEGYERGGPWKVDLTTEDAVLAIANSARRGGATITKIDSVTRESLAGAELVVHYDADADGHHESEVVRLTSTGGESAMVVTDLLPGDYVVEEVDAPGGYVRAGPVTFSVAPGAQIEVEVLNQPRSTVSFEKVPAGLHDPEAMSLAGATFVIDGTGACTTDASGVCMLPPLALEGGSEYCWEETVAPVGWAPADGECFVAAAEPGSTHTVVVREPSLYAQVDGRKVDAETGAGLGRAVYDLYRVDDEELGPAPSRPVPNGAVPLAAHAWVGRAESDRGGLLVWPPQIAGYTYCALERHAPSGYLRDSELTCTRAPLELEGAVLHLADHPIPIVVERIAVERVVIETRVVEPMERPAPPRPAPAAPPLAATGSGTARLFTLGVTLIGLGALLSGRTRARYRHFVPESAARRGSR